MLYVLILTNVKLKHAIMMSYFHTISDGVFQDSILWHLSRIFCLLKEATTEYGERSMSTLALSENDLALTSPCPTEPEDPMRAENKTDADFNA